MADHALSASYAAPRRALLASLVAAAAWPRRAGAEWLRDEVVVYADPALRPVLDAIAAHYPATLRVFCAAPRQMLGLLAHGTQDDVLISETRFVVQAQGSGLAAPGMHLLWRNRLALAGRGPAAGTAPFSAAGLAAALGDGKLAVPDPGPAVSVDGMAVLDRLGLTAAFAGRIQGAASSADALGMLHTGDAVMALCHVTEIIADNRVHIAMCVPPTAYDPIEYAAVLTKAAWSRHQDALITALPQAPEARRFGLETLA